MKRVIAQELYNNLRSEVNSGRVRRQARYLSKRRLLVPLQVRGHLVNIRVVGQKRNRNAAAEHENPRACNSFRLFALSSLVAPDVRGHQGQRSHS